MRAKLNMYIRDKYTNSQQALSSIGFSTGKNCDSSNSAHSQPFAADSRRTHHHKVQESNLTEVALLDKLTPCMKTLQGQV
jgi:hypothetical protein